MTEKSTALSCQQQVELITETNIKINGLSNINETLSTHYLIYRIDNLQNGRYYIGQHKTEDPLDKYMGSGVLIINAVAKHGVENFMKTILFDFDNFEEMNGKEKELVPLSACYPNNPMSYNLREGGYEGTYGPRPPMAEETKRKLSYSQKKFWSSLTEDERRKKSKLFGQPGIKNPMYGEKLKDHMTPESYESWEKKLRCTHEKNAKNPEWHKKLSELTSGENNPMYGKNWQDFSTPERVAQWREHLSQATSGKNNPMYGKDSWAKHTPEERAARAQRYSQSMKGKNKGRKVMQLPGTNVLKAVRPDEVQDYLNQGYVFSSRQKREQIANIQFINPNTIL